MSKASQVCQVKFSSRRIRELAQKNRGWRLNVRAESAELDKVPAFTPVINLLKVQLLLRGLW